MYKGIFVIFVLIFTACSKEKITRYSAPKDPIKKIVKHGAGDGHNHGSQEEKHVKDGKQQPKNNHAVDAKVLWTVPAGWQNLTGVSMSLAAFHVGSANQGAKISLFRFPGTAGGIAANVNRWRSQVGLKTLPEKDILSLAEKLNTSLGQAFVWEIVNSEQKNGIIATIIPLDGVSFFVKIQGHLAILKSEKEHFIEFCKSLKLSHGK